jgi:hypothetical protein
MSFALRAKDRLEAQPIICFQPVSFSTREVIAFPIEDVGPDSLRSLSEKLFSGTVIISCKKKCLVLDKEFTCPQIEKPGTPSSKSYSAC